MSQHHRKFDEVYSFSFPKGIPKYFAIAMCKEAQTKVPTTAIYKVITDPSDKTSYIAELSHNGAKLLKKNLEDMVGGHRYTRFNLPKHALEFLADQVIIENDFKVMFVVSIEDKYLSRIDAYGPDRESLFGTLRQHFEKYHFNIPQILSKIIRERMICQLEKEAVDIIPCGQNSIVYPRGEFAEDFIDEFKSLYRQLVEQKIEYLDISDQNILKACKEVGIKDTYYFIKDHSVVLRGLKESVMEFSSKLPLKLFAPEKNIDTLPSPEPRVKICSSPVDKKLDQLCDIQISFGESN